MRLHQWVKNSFILLPLFFGLKFNQTDTLFETLFVAFGFSFLTSAVYMFNDSLDIEQDKLHPEKKNRPLASGTISKNNAYAQILILLCLGSLIVFFSTNSSMAYYLIGFYLFQNLLYTLRLKHIALLDVFIISVGFVLRVLIGGAVSDVELSSWIVLMTFLLAFFLSISKRYDDLIIIEKSQKKVRKNLEGYNLTFVKTAMGVLSSAVLICYIMYTISPEVVSRFGAETYYTAPLVLLGMLRYLQLTFVFERSGSPTKILYNDRFLQIIIVSWLVLFYFIIYD